MKALLSALCVFAAAVAVQAASSPRPNDQRGFRDDRWKLIRYPQIDRTQLFDLRGDTEETKNLADRPENASRIKTMMAALAAEMKRLDDPVTSLSVAQPKPAAFNPPAPAQNPASPKKTKDKKAKKA